MITESSKATRERQHSGAHVRAVAARLLREVIEEGTSLNTLLPNRLQNLANTHDRSLCQEFIYGTLRFLPRLEWFAARLLKHPLANDASDVHALILVGLYQLDILETPAHVAVSNTVEACRDLGKPWACDLVNAVLRAFARRWVELRAAAKEDRVAHYAHPAWLNDVIECAWQEEWRHVLEGNNQRAPMTLRVNRLQTTRQEYLQVLEQAGVRAVATPYADCGIQLARPVTAHELPGFSAGLVSVQDQAAQLAAGLLDIQPGQRVLDACAAPGGKTAHILESQPAIAELVALDNDATRVGSLHNTLARLRLRATVVTEDALQPDIWWDQRQFERILLDAPCTATGVIRRHPDIKCLRRHDDVMRLAATQRRLLAALWPLLAPGGKLLYATCSVLPAENVEPVRDFLAVHPAAAHIDIHVTWGRKLVVGRQILPGECDMDGFFYALLVKH